MPLESTATPLNFASQEGFIKIVELLLSNKANPNFQDVNGWTALRFATRNNRLEVVKLLVENKATVDSRAKDLATPFASAISKGYLNIAEYLIKTAPILIISMLIKKPRLCTVLRVEIWKR